MALLPLLRLRCRFLAASLIFWLFAAALPAQAQMPPVARSPEQYQMLVQLMAEIRPALEHIMGDRISLPVEIYSSDLLVDASIQDIFRDQFHERLEEKALAFAMIVEVGANSRLINSERSEAFSRQMTPSNAACLVAFHADFFEQTPHWQRVSMAHELYHCYQYQELLRTSRLVLEPKWFVEGSAALAAYLAVPPQDGDAMDVEGITQLTGWLTAGRAGLEDPETDYEAFGLFLNFHNRGVDMMQVFKQLLQLPPAEIMSGMVHRLPADVVATWPSSLMDYEQWGPEWSIAGVDAWRGGQGGLDDVRVPGFERKEHELTVSGGAASSTELVRGKPELLHILFRGSPVRWYIITFNHGFGMLRYTDPVTNQVRNLTLPYQPHTELYICMSDYCPPPCTVRPPTNPVYISSGPGVRLGVVAVSPAGNNSVLGVVPYPNDCCGGGAGVSPEIVGEWWLHVPSVFGPQQQSSNPETEFEGQSVVTISERGEFRQAVSASYRKYNTRNGAHDQVLQVEVSGSKQACAYSTHNPARGQVYVGQVSVSSEHYEERSLPSGVSYWSPHGTANIPSSFMAIDTVASRNGRRWTINHHTK